jgi:protein-S-isoprenylcysteine O-methyltransferase Ste14
MYAGVGFSLLGIGLWLDQTGIAFAGLVWFLVIAFRCRQEEKLLLRRFGKEYQVYQQHTPIFIPHFQMMILDRIHRKVHHSRKKDRR